MATRKAINANAALHSLLETALCIMNKSKLANALGKVLRFACVLAGLSSCLSQAAQIQYDTASGVTDLSQPSAWIGGVAPAENDTALVAGAGGDFTLGAAVSWKGLVLSNLTANVTISGEELTLGADGISPGGPVSPNFQTTFLCPIVITCDQEWYSLDDKAIIVAGGVSGTGRLTTRNYAWVGHGKYEIRSSLDVPWNARGTDMCLANGATVNGDVAVGWDYWLRIFPTGTEETAFSSIFKTGHVINDGHIVLGGGGVRPNVVLGQGDWIVGDEMNRNGTLSANVGVIESCGTFKMTGGSVSNKLFKLRDGDFIQEGGSVMMRDGFQMLHVNARLGSNTRLDVSGGTFTAKGIEIGTASDPVVSNIFAAVNMSGGEMAIGADGICLGSEAWEAGRIGEEQGAWYKVWLSGGLYRAVGSHANTAAVALEGEREIAVESGVTMTQVGMMSGAASLTKTGAGTLVLPQVCAWTGTTTVAAGTLVSYGGVVPPVPYIAFKADDLNLADGDTVTEWRSVSNDGTHTNAFTKSISSGVGIPNLPQYRASRIGGHAAVVFNGMDEGLAMTSGTGDDSPNASPTFNASNLTVGVVFRASSSSAGGTNDSAFDAGGIVSQCYGNSNTRWSLSVTSNGIVGSGVRPAGATGTTVWSDRPSVFDGKPHVAFYSWSAGDKVRINLDGTWTEVADGSGAQHISRNRMLVGVGEGQGGGQLRYFGGEIAEIRIYKDQMLSDGEVDAIGLGLATEYGACYLPSGDFAMPSPNASVSLPDPSGLWCADDLALSAGEDVTVWQDAIRNGEFRSTLGSNIASANGISGTAAPKIAPETMNGHKAVRFEASRKTVLAMTGSDGNGSRYIGSGGTNFAVVIVARPISSQGGAWASTFQSAGLLGMAYADNNNQRKWGIGISGDGGATPCDQVAAGIRDGTADAVDVHGRPRGMCDGRSHVVICSFGTNLTVNVDGVRTTHRNATTMARHATRTTLGFLEVLRDIGVGGMFFSGDVAEIRFYPDTVLTVAQQNAIGRELAAKYGADMGGFCAEDGNLFASPRVTVASGATLCGNGDGFQIPSGTVLEGEGRLVGRVVVGPGGVLDTTAGVPIADAQVVFLAGGILRIAADANGKTVPLHVPSVAWPTSGGMTLDLTAAGKTPSGTVLSWDDGEVPDVSGWTVLGGDPTTTLSVKIAKRCVEVKTRSGFSLIFR